MTFKKYDVNKDGFLESFELFPMLQDAVNHIGKGYKINSIDVQNFLDRSDINHNNKLEKKEVCTIFENIACHIKWNGKRQWLNDISFNLIITVSNSIDWMSNRIN